VLKFSVEAVAAMHAFRLKPCPTFHLLTGHKVYPGAYDDEDDDEDGGGSGGWGGARLACRSEVWITGKLGGSSVRLFLLLFFSSRYLHFLPIQCLLDALCCY